MLKVHRKRFLSIFGTSRVIQKLRIYNLLYFESFIKFDVMLEEHPELSRK